MMLTMKNFMDLRKDNEMSTCVCCGSPVPEGRHVCPNCKVSVMGIKDSGERTEFATGAVRDMHEGKGRFDLLPMCVLMRLAKHYENGCLKYGDRNWEKGIPCHSFADSAMRHLVKYMDGWKDEDHLVAAIWNLCGLAWTEEKRPDLMDIPARLEHEHEQT